MASHAFKNFTEWQQAHYDYVREFPRRCGKCYVPASADGRCVGDIKLCDSHANVLQYEYEKDRTEHYDAQKRHNLELSRLALERIAISLNGLPEKLDKVIQLLGKNAITPAIPSAGADGAPLSRPECYP